MEEDSRCTCCFFRDADKDGDDPCKGRCSLPKPKRQTPPLGYHKYELRECFPCYYYSSYLVNKFPFVKWLVRYNARWLLSDIIAGLTVGLMVVPQGLAYANIARLPPRYGLFSAFMGCFVYTIFGTSKDVTLGPTAILSLLTASLTDDCGPEEEDYNSRIPCAVALTFFSGAVQLLLGILNLGFLVDFIPVPVISGFTSAAAITIAVGQLKNLLGIKNVRRDFHYAIYDLCRNIAETKVWDLVLGICCIILVVFLKWFKSHNMRLQQKKLRLSWMQKIAFKFLWLLCTARNAVVVLIAAVIGYTLSIQPWFNNQITLIQYNESIMPDFELPDLSVQTCQNLGIGILVAPLIGFLESIAIAKAFARQEGYSVEPSQELVAIGASNLASSFVGSYPVTGSFSRTAVNAQSGVRTPAAGIVTGGVVLLALGVVSGGFHFIPAASLAAIIIAAVIPVVDVMIVWRILRLNFIDLLPLVISFLLTLFLGIEYGVPVAVVVYVLYLLYRHARPRHEVTLYGNVVCVVMNGGWNYPGVDYILKRIHTEVTLADDDMERERTRSVILDCSAMPEVDYTVVQAIKECCEELSRKGVQVIVIKAQPQVEKLLNKAKIENIHFLSSLETALEMNSGVQLHKQKLSASATVQGGSKSQMPT